MNSLARMMADGRSVDPCVPFLPCFLPSLKFVAGFFVVSVDLFGQSTFFVRSIVEGARRGGAGGCVSLARALSQNEENDLQWGRALVLFLSQCQCLGLSLDPHPRERDKEAGKGLILGLRRT